MGNHPMGGTREFTCPSCPTTLEIESNYVGTVECPNCNSQIHLLMGQQTNGPLYHLALLIIGIFFPFLLFGSLYYLGVPIESSCELACFASIGIIVYGFATKKGSLAGGVMGGLAAGGVTVIMLFIVALIAALFFVGVILPALWGATCGTIPVG